MGTHVVAPRDRCSLVSGGPAGCGLPSRRLPARRLESKSPRQSSHLPRCWQQPS
ncbi:hypothetical protein B0H14DRAFT_3868460, partial [Mycena olivaceomarginata]